MMRLYGNEAPKKSNAKDREQKATGNRGKIIAEDERQKATWNRGKIMPKAKPEHGIEVRQLSSSLVHLFQNESKCENEFCMQFHFHANQSHFHKNGFARRLALKQRHKGTRKWPIQANCRIKFK